MNDNQQCFICSKHKGEIEIPGGIIFEDDLVYIGHIGFDLNKDTYLGYIMIDIKRHVPTLADLTDAESQRLGFMITQISKALKKSEEAEHIYVQVIGDNVAHVHVHIIPRYPDTPKEFWGFKVSQYSLGRRGGKVEVEEICQRIRTKLQE
ncbi:HIT family protein [Paenibacillus sedimenti]|uniref:HIT family protein n=1 Tax=Paenibacillus sedimenti TaxID=2770274 RepID=A0A926KZM4_9BACL|nr:HIT family protein [Paenibacillus sedimenti]MBD0384875.1 HIT family protein [Paenibacillus sedimenti]